MSLIFFFLNCDILLTVILVHIVFCLFFFLDFKEKILFALVFKGSFGFHLVK